jgi:2-methylcitrate dehydratase PrpD
VTAAQRFADFVVGGEVPGDARAVAASAVLDTVGVTLAGASEPASIAVQHLAAEEGGAARCRILATSQRTGAGLAALANGTAAHALDYDDMCFVSLAHPSAPLVAAALAAGELVAARGRALLDAYVVGFEIEAVLGRVMNPRHYTQGWHCTSTLGTIGAAAAAARLLSLDREATARCLSIAASEASGLKENFGTMTKPLHAGLAARGGVDAVLLARRGLTASARAIDGPQGYLAAMASARGDLGDAPDALGRRWEIVETGVTVKLYPSCAGTHPALDAILGLRRQHQFGAADIESIDIGVDAVTPTILIHDRPATGLEGKFSMQFCAAAAAVAGRVGLDTFNTTSLNDPSIRALLPRVTMKVDASLRTDAPALTQARVAIRLRDGRTLTAYADGARGYPDRSASSEELAEKFRTCAAFVMDPEAVEHALGMLRSLDILPDIRALTSALTKQQRHEPATDRERSRKVTKRAAQRDVPPTDR